MRKEYVSERRRFIVTIMSVGVLLLGICAAFFVFPHQRAKAADISSSYSWSPVKIGGGGFVTGLVIHPKTQNIMYARTDVGGAYRWDANSQTWSQMVLASNIPSASVNDYGVESIAVSASNDQVVYAALGATYDTTYPDNGRILKSTDRGQTWSDTSGQKWYMHGNGDDRTGVERLAVDPNNDNIVYYGSRTEGLWISTNAGSSWQQVTAIPKGSNPGGTGTPYGVRYITFDPSGGTTNGVTNRIYVGVSGQGVYRSDDGGDNWYNIYSTDQAAYFGAVDANGTFYATFQPGGGNGTVQKYDPNAKSWADITPCPCDGSYIVAVDPFNTQRLFVSPGGTRNGHFWRSTNGGSSWDTLNVSLSSANIPWILNTDEANYLTTGQLLFDPFVKDELWFAQGTGVWQATNLSDATINWNFKTDGIEETVANDIIAPPGGKPITAIQDRKGFYQSDVNAYPQKPLVDEKFNDGTSLDYSGNNTSFVVLASCDTRNINPCESGYSNDDGQTWTQFSGSGNYSDLYGGNIAVSASDTNDIVWLPTNNKQPYYSTDKGATWNKIGAFANVTGLHSIIWWGWKKALDSDKVTGGKFYIYSTENGGEFYRSTDGGQTWTKTAAAPSSTTGSSANDSNVFGQVRAVPGHADNVWMSNAQGGLSYTTNAGDSWTQVSAVQQARGFGFGVPIDGATYPTIYANAQINNKWGIWRSTDAGNTWDLLSSYPLNLADQVDTVNGDMNIAGRVYVGFAGNGFAYGDSSDSGTATPTSTPSTTSSTTFTATADRDNWAQHTGKEPLLDVSVYQYAYLKFDLSHVRRPFQSVLLRIYRPDINEGDITITAYQITHDSWKEDSNKLPAPGTKIAAVASSTVGFVDFDVTSYAQTARSHGNTVSFAFNASCSQWQSLNSRESSSNQPQLIVTAS